MARTRKTAAKKKTSTVSVNFKGVQSRQLLPEDDYRLKLVEAEQGESSSGNDQIEWVFAVNDGSKFDGQKLWFYTPLTETSLWKLHALLTAMGVEVPDDELELDLEQMVEDELGIMGVVQHETYDGTKRSKLMDFYAIDGGDEADDEKPAKGAKGKKAKAAGVTKDAVEGMDRDELEELIAEHDLDVDADDKAYKKDAKLMAAVLEALEENDLLVEDDAGDEEPEEMTAAQKRAARRKARKAKDAGDDEEDEKPSRGRKSKAKDDEEEEDEKPAKKGAKSKKLPKLSSDEVQGMDEDELGEVIEKYGLDTDLDDYKTLRKKAAAVIDALEDGDHIEDDE